MIAAQLVRDGRARYSRLDRPGRVITSPPSPASMSSQLTREQGQYVGKNMGTYTRAVCVNEAKTLVKSEVVAFARSAPAKVLSRATGISESRIYDWRAERFGANAATLEVIRRYRIEEAKRRMAEAEAVIRQSLGPVAEYFPDAVEQVLRGGK